MDITAVLQQINQNLGGSSWFVFTLLGVGFFFTLYLKFPQIRYFKHSIKVVRGDFDRAKDKGDTSHFQSLTTALSGTIGTGNIAGVALAISLGGPTAIFWMIITALLGMCTKFVEVTLSHKYREFDSSGAVAGGPMYYMKRRLDIKLPSGKEIKTGALLGGVFSVGMIISSFGTGNFPQINSIATAMKATFHIEPWITGLVLSILLGLVIIGGIKRIAKVTEKLVPFMAIIYVVGALVIIFSNLENLVPSFVSIFSNVLDGNAAVGGFLGASASFAFNQGVNRGLFSNEAGQGSAPIAHAAAKTHEPVSEGIVAILEPFIDTVVVCTITGLAILSSGVWTEKFENTFQVADLHVVEGQQHTPEELALFLSHEASDIIPFNGILSIENGEILSDVTVIHARSVAEEVVLSSDGETYHGNLQIAGGKPLDPAIVFSGKSLVHSSKLTTEAFKKGVWGGNGKYIVSLGLLLFAFSSTIAWSYYGDRALSFLGGEKMILAFRLLYIIGFFVAALVDTTIIWIISGIAIALTALPNLIGMILLHKEMKASVKDYWDGFNTKE